MAGRTEAATGRRKLDKKSKRLESGSYFKYIIVAESSMIYLLVFLSGLAGFFLPLWIGFRATCVGAMIITTLVTITALRLSRNPVLQTAWDDSKVKKGK